MRTSTLVLLLWSMTGCDSHMCSLLLKIVSIGFEQSNPVTLTLVTCCWKFWTSRSLFKFDPKLPFNHSSSKYINTFCRFILSITLLSKQGRLKLSWCIFYKVTFMTFFCFYFLCFVSNFFKPFLFIYCQTFCTV